MVVPSVRLARIWQSHCDGTFSCFWLWIDPHYKCWLGSPETWDRCFVVKKLNHHFMPFSHTKVLCLIVGWQFGFTLTDLSRMASDESIVNSQILCTALVHLTLIGLIWFSIHLTRVSCSLSIVPSSRQWLWCIELAVVKNGTIETREHQKASHYTAAECFFLTCGCLLIMSRVIWQDRIRLDSVPLRQSYVLIGWFAHSTWYCTFNTQIVQQQWNKCWDEGTSPSS